MTEDDVYPFYKGKCIIALIDKTQPETTIIIMIDKYPDKYIQHFWMKGTDKELVDQCILMRKLKVEPY